MGMGIRLKIKSFTFPFKKERKRSKLRTKQSLLRQRMLEIEGILTAKTFRKT